MSDAQYNFGYGEYMLKMLKESRNFERCAKFLAPYLKPNFTLLDCGCGPGTITSGFAQYLSDGTVTALDIDEGQLKITQEHCDQLGLDNVLYEKASMLNLPFADNSFDVAYTHAVLPQVKNYSEALAELVRVVKPGGIVALREPDFGGVILYPEDTMLLEAHQYRAQSLLSHGTNICIGRELRKLLQDANCQKTKISVTNEVYADEKSLSWVCEYIANEISQAPYSLDNLKKGLISSEKIAAYHQAWKDFSKHKDAFFSGCWVEAIGFK